MNKDLNHIFAFLYPLAPNLLNKWKRLSKVCHYVGIKYNYYHSPSFHCK